MRRLNGILILIIITGQLLAAQTGQDPIRISMPYPVHSQYLQNGLIINPAYAGSRESLSLFGSVRKQWWGIPGSPLFETLSIHSLLKNNHIGLGMTAQFLTYGPTQAISVYAVYAYHLNLGRTVLSMGMRGGFDYSNTNYSGIQTVVKPDDAFPTGNVPYFMPNVGAGVYLYNRKFFVGASIPQFLGYVKSNSGNVSFSAFQKIDVQATAGCLLRFSPVFKFKPSVFVDYSLDRTKPMRIDINGNFIISDLVWVGGSWRTNEKVAVGILQLQVSPKIMIGYSYDYALGTMSTYSKGSHEMILRYEFGYKVTASNPRYF
ncbi:MAG TPA: type IX secretion system membrane protein PorP/SprF [Bacteroidales bacterium]|nr:type IX secretion system membrane protein PorP/SprF [Bacteroidales bacterium]